MSLSGDSGSEDQEFIDTVLDAVETANPPISEESSIVAASGSATDLLATLLQETSYDHSYRLSPSRLISVSDPNLASTSGYPNPNYDLDFPLLTYTPSNRYDRLVQESSDLLDSFASTRAHASEIEQRINNIAQRLDLGAFNPITTTDNNLLDIVESESSEYLELALGYQVEEYTTPLSPSPPREQLVAYTDSEGSSLSNIVESNKPIEIIYENKLNIGQSEESLNSIQNINQEINTNQVSVNNSSSSSNSVISQSNSIEDINMAIPNNQADLNAADRADREERRQYEFIPNPIDTEALRRYAFPGARLSGSMVTRNIDIPYFNIIDGDIESTRGIVLNMYARGRCSLEKWSQSNSQRTIAALEDVAPNLPDSCFAARDH